MIMTPDERTAEETVWRKGSATESFEYQWNEPEEKAAETVIRAALLRETEMI